MTNIREMNDRVQGWMSEKPQGGGNKLFVRKDDLVIFNFASNGDDGDELLKVYRSHIVTTVVGNKRDTKQRYCPLKNGEDMDCPLCQQGHDIIKERMSIWMYVTNILHAQMPADKQFPRVNYQNRDYFNEEVNGFRVWETSAWKNSPWIDICKLFEVYKGLHNFTAQLTRTGDGIDTLYKVYAMPNSEALSPDLYTRAKEECTPIPQTLRAEVSSPVAVNPAGASPVGQTSTVTPFTVPGAPSSSPVFRLGTAPSTYSVQEQVDVPEEEQPVEPEEPNRPIKGLF